MNYEKKYKEIVGQIRKAYLYAQTDSTKAVLEEIFPELAESEDEKVRKEIVRFIRMEVEDEIVGNKWLAWLEKQGQVKKSTISQHEIETCKENGNSLTYEDERIINIFRKVIYGCNKGEMQMLGDKERDDCLAWLERQGEHANFRNMIQVGDKVTRKENGVLVNLSQLNRVAKKDENPADKVEPKFKVGDWVVNKFGDSWHIDSFDKKNYQVSNGNGYNYFPISKQNEMRLWTVQDAKDGDVLYLQHEWKEHIIIYKGVIKERFRTFVSAYCAYNGIVDAFCFADVSRYIDIAYGGIMPATKEQRDLLFQKMHEAGYEWDAEKKELKEIEQTPDWSDEDESILQGIWDEILANKHDAKEYEWKTYDKFLNWLKSLKERIGGKECVERWAELIIPAVFRAEDALLKNKPEWKERIANATDDYMSDIAKEYCREIAEIIVRGAEDFDEEEGL